jgi:hypothetical protein
MKNLLNFDFYNYPSVVEAVILAAKEQGFPVSASGVQVSSLLKGEYDKKEYLHFHFRDSGADVYQDGVSIGYHCFQGQDVTYGRYANGQTIVQFIQDFATTPAKEVVAKWVEHQLNSLAKEEGWWKNQFYTTLIRELYNK